MPKLRLLQTVIFASVAAFSAAAPLKIVVDGKVKTISAEEVQALPSHDVALKEHDGTMPIYTGPLISDVLAKFGVELGDHVKGKALATYVLVKASDGYEVIFGLGELESSISGHQIVLAYKAGGQPLIASAAPFRVVVEGDKKQARSIRMVTEIDVVHLAKSDS